MLDVNTTITGIKGQYVIWGNYHMNQLTINRNLIFSKNLVRCFPMPEKRRERNRSNNYSNRVHSDGELSRKALKKKKRAQERQGLNPNGEYFEKNSKPIDMEPDQEYHF